MNEKVVEVTMDSRKVGRIALDKDGRALFEYDADWIRNGISISPFHLPLESRLFTAEAKPFEGNFGVFDDSLPDGWSALILDRYLRAQGKSLASLNLLEQLMFVGSRGRGALEYHPDLSTVDEQDIIDLDRMAEESQRVLNTDYSDNLDKAWRRGGSSGGTRPKVFVHYDGAEWLVKFRDRTDPPHVGKIEYETSLLARECGIEMAETRLFDGKYFGTKRFDRTEEGGKLHVISLSALMNLDFHLPTADYGHLFWACSQLTHSVKELWKVYRLMAFNLLIGNCDDHVKNFAFIHRNDAWQLAPAYDVLPCEGFGGFHSLSVNGNYKDPGKTDAVQLAAKFGLSKEEADAVFEEIRKICKVR